jgi:HEPN domain-containing protein
MNTIETIRTFAASIKLKQSNAYVEMGDGGALTYKMDILPAEFLYMAENALTGDPPNYVDAVSNAQRAVRSQIKYAIGALGFDGRKLKIKEQIKLLEQVGLLAPRILRKISTPRNLMEHQYRKPSAEEAEDAVDLAALFVEATGRVMNLFWSGFSIQKKIGKRYEDRIFARFLEAPRVFEIRLLASPGKRTVLEITSADPLFIPLHKIAIALSREHSGHQSPAVSDSFFDLLDLIGIP